MSKVLIIEDERSIAELEKDYLELSEFTVDIETDGEVGLKRALEGDYDIFVLDLMLPGVDGFEICQKIREVKDTPILMVSARKDDIDNSGAGAGGRRLCDQALLSLGTCGQSQGSPGPLLPSGGDFSRAK